MIIQRKHPKYKVKIDPDDETIFGKPFGDVPFTQKEFEFNYSDKVKEKDIPTALSKILCIKKSIVMKAWEAHPPHTPGGGRNLK